MEWSSVLIGLLSVVVLGMLVAVVSLLMRKPKVIKEERVIKEEGTPALIPFYELNVREVGDQKESKILRLRYGQEVAIGSDSSDAIVVPGPYVSRGHCKVRYSDSGWEIMDNHSRNGTKVDGQKTDSEKYIPLQDNSIVELGDSRLQFRILTA